MKCVISAATNSDVCTGSYPQRSSRGAGAKAKSGYSDGIYCVFPRQQQAIECADQHNHDVQQQKQNQQSTSGIGLPVCTAMTGKTPRLCPMVLISGMSQRKGSLYEDQ